MAMDQAPAQLEEPSRANHVAMYFGGILITHARGTAALAASKIRELHASATMHTGACRAKLHAWQKAAKH
jgi:hypothetical protein